MTLDNAANPELQIKKEKKITKETATKKDGDTKPADTEDEDGELAADDAAAKVDPIRSESINILRDLIEFSRTPPATASTERPPPPRNSGTAAGYSARRVMLLAPRIASSVERTCESSFSCV